MRRRGSASIAANPVLIGAATTLVVIVAVFLAYNANNGLPFVPTYSLKVDVPERRAAREGQRGAPRRHARRRRSTKIKPVRHRDGTVTARARPEARDDRQAAADRLDRASSGRGRRSGLKYVELTKGTVEAGLRRRRHDAAHAGQARARSRSTSSSTCSTTRRAPRRACNLQRVRRRARRPRAWTSTSAIQAFNPLLDQPRAGDAQPVGPAHEAAAAFPRARADAPPQVAPVAETQAELFKNLDTTFGAFANVAQPYIQQSISEGPPALDAATTRVPAAAAVPAQQRAVLPRAAARRRARCAPPRRTSPTRSRSARGSLARTPAFNKQPRAARSQRCRSFAEDPLVALGVKDLTNTAQHPRPDDRLPHARRRRSATTSRSGSATSRSLLSEGDKQRHRPALHRHRRARTAPTTRAARRRRPANGGGPARRTTTCTPTRTRTPRRPASPRSARPPTRTTSSASTVIGNDPGNQGTTHDATKRGMTQ